MTETQDETPFELAFTRLFFWDTVQPRGTQVTVEATAEERQAVTELLDIVSIQSIVGRFTITPWRRTGFRITGEVQAEVEQACVVTLDPVPETVRETVDVTYLPASEIEPPADEEIEVALDAEDPPEAIDGPAVDLGMLATEFVAVGLDPYPRKPGVEFTPFIEDDGSNDALPSPFAALGALKPKDD